MVKYISMDIIYNFIVSEFRSKKYDLCINIQLDHICIVFGIPKIPWPNMFRF